MCVYVLCVRLVHTGHYIRVNAFRGCVILIDAMRRDRGRNQRRAFTFPCLNRCELWFLIFEFIGNDLGKKWAQFDKLMINIQLSVLLLKSKLFVKGIELRIFRRMYVYIFLFFKFFVQV